MTRHTRFARPVFMTIAATLLLTGVAEVRIATVAAAESASPTAPGAHDAASTPKSTPEEPPSLEPLTGRDCTGVLGKKIIGPDGKELGLVVDVLVDDLGRPRAAVIDFGGFLGVGSRKIAVDWRLLKPVPGQPDWKLSLNLDRAEIQGAPEYKPDEASNKMVGPVTAKPLPDAAQ
jgi:hypothetical protein